MNISMAKLQDTLVSQPTLPDAEQKQLIQEHPALSETILRSFGALNDDLLDIVRLHHDRDETQGLERNLECRRILHLADVLIGKMVHRSTRPGLSALGASKSNIVGAQEEDARVGKAMTTAIGFYPPGTYVMLANGEKAVSVKKGPAVNTPLVVSIANAQGLPLGIYVLRDTREKMFAIQSPVAADNVKINHERVHKAAMKVITAAQ
jgi:hypothetical protein